MPLVNVFIIMTLICLGVSTLCTMYGWGCMLAKRLGPAERAFACARDAMMSTAGFGFVALFGLLFV